MHRIETLQSVASRAGLSEASQRLSAIERAASGAAPIVVPLVGEFSAGKTSLLNSLMDSGVLETAVTPTTAAIFEVHFGAPQCRGVVTAQDGASREVDDLKKLRNDDVEASAVVQVYDTSTKVPATTLLVDTPGLSSPKQQHRQTLVDFLPQADAILLVADVNQQVTRSLTDFVRTAQLAGRPLFLVLTKTDSKSASAVRQARDYAARNSELGVEKVVCVSAQKGDVGELLDLLADVAARKGEILSRVAAAKAEQIAAEMLASIDAMLASIEDPAQLQRDVATAARELQRGRDKLSRLLDGLKLDIDQATLNSVQQLGGNLQQRLMDIAATASRESVDAEAAEAVNSARSLFLSQFVAQVRQLFAAKVTEWQRKEQGVDAAQLDAEALNAQINLDNGYNMGLASVGHEYDTTIAGGLTIAASIVLTKGLLGKAAIGKAAGKAGTKLLAGQAAGQAIYQFTATSGQVEQTAQTASRGMLMLQTGAKQVQKWEKEGTLTKLIGKVTELGAKPQRVRAVMNFLEAHVLPDFKQELTLAAERVKANVTDMLQAEMERVNADRQAAVEQLRDQLRAKKADAASSREELKQCRNLILNR